MSAGPGRSRRAPCPGRSSATHSYSARRATSGSQARALSPDPCTNTSVRVLRGIAPSPLAPLAPFVIALLSRNGLLSPEQPLSPFLRRPHALTWQTDAGYTLPPTGLAHAGRRFLSVDDTLPAWNVSPHALCRFRPLLPASPGCGRRGLSHPGAVSYVLATVEGADER